MSAGGIALRLAVTDNIAVAARPLAAGTVVDIDGIVVALLADVAVGHKFALREIPEGGLILKYNCPIGTATRAIAAGENVHTHNVRSNYLPTYTLRA